MKKCLILLLLLIFILSGCATYKPQYKTTGSLNPYPKNKEIEHVFYLIGDAGKNTETQVLYEEFITTNTTKPIIIARDAVDLSFNSAHKIINQANIILVMSFSQLQKLFQAVHYPIVVTHSMTNLRLVEAIHKFSLTYPINLVVFHNQQLFASANGQVISTPLTNPTELWRGAVPAKIATWCTFFPNKKIEAIITSIIA